MKLIGAYYLVNVFYEPIIFIELFFWMMVALAAALRVTLGMCQRTIGPCKFLW